MPFSTAVFRLVRNCFPGPAAQPGDVQAVALSAYADAASGEAALAAGFTAFLAQPARPGELVELVRSLLHRAR